MVVQHAMPAEMERGSEGNSGYFDWKLSSSYDEYFMGQELTEKGMEHIWRGVMTRESNWKT